MVKQRRPPLATQGKTLAAPPGLLPPPPSLHRHRRGRRRSRACPGRVAAGRFLYFRFSRWTWADLAAVGGSGGARRSGVGRLTGRRPSRWLGRRWVVAARRRGVGLIWAAGSSVRSRAGRVDAAPGRGAVPGFPLLRSRAGGALACLERHVPVRVVVGGGCGEVEVGRHGRQGMGTTRSGVDSSGSAPACLVCAVVLRRGGGGGGSIRSGRIWPAW